MTITAAPTSTAAPAATPGEAKSAGADLFQLLLGHAVESSSETVSAPTAAAVTIPAKAPTKATGADAVDIDPAAAAAALPLAAMAGLVLPVVVSPETSAEPEVPALSSTPTPAKTPADAPPPTAFPAAPVFTVAPLASTRVADTAPSTAPTFSGRPKASERVATTTQPSADPASGGAANPIARAPHAAASAKFTAMPPAAAPTASQPADTSVFSAAPVTAGVSDANTVRPVERPRLVDTSPAPRTATTADTSTASPVPAPMPQLVTAPTAPIAVQPVIAPNPQQPLTQQLAQPLMTLAQGENGEKTVVVRVAPDELGPVTVRAHLSDTTVRFELSAPSAAGREALRHILPELRADLNSASTNGFVNVADQNGQTADSKAHAQQAWAQPQEGNRRGQTAGEGQDAPEPRTATKRSVYTLDVLA